MGSHPLGGDSPSQGEVMVNSLYEHAPNGLQQAATEIARTPPPRPSHQVTA